MMIEKQILFMGRVLKKTGGLNILHYNLIIESSLSLQSTKDTNN